MHRPFDEASYFIKKEYLVGSHKNVKFRKVDQFIFCQLFYSIFKLVEMVHQVYFLGYFVPIAWLWQISVHNWYSPI